MSVVVHRTRIILCAILLLAVIGHASAQESKQIPWQDETFTGTLFEEDVRNVLRRLLAANGGMQAIFKPGVEAEITLQFDNMPLQAVFNQLIEENELDYRFDAATNTVTIFTKATARVGEPVRKFITPQAVTIEIIRQVLQNFGMSVENVLYDAPSNTVSISGSQEEVAEISRLIDQLDRNAVERRARQREINERAQEQRRIDEERAFEERRLAIQSELEEKRIAEQLKLETQRAKEDRRREEQRRKFEAKLLDEVLNQQVKIIRLRFASVGATTKTFQGQTFSVPGIGDTIEKVLGIPSGTATLAAGGQTTVISGGRTESRSLADAAFLEQLGDAAKPVISIDERTNSVIVRGSPKAIEEVEKIIRQLDTPLRMIEIEVVIVKAQKTVIEELGVAYRGSVSKNSASGTSGSAAFDSGSLGTGTAAGVVTAANSAITLLPGPDVGGLDAAFLITDGRSFLQVQLTALKQDNRIEVIASTNVITLDNISARVTRAANVFITTQGSGDTVDTLSEIKTGLTLEITPSIVPADIAGEQRLIRLSLNSTNSSPTAGVAGEVTVEAQEIQTEVLIPDGATFVFGGLFDDNRTEDHSGIPGLMDIPVLGALFRTDISSDTLTETVFFITPRIIDERELLAPDIAVRVGTREYMKRQRNALDELSREIEDATGRYFPNALQTLEEDE